MEIKDKKTMITVVFSVMIIMAIIIFMFLMANMQEKNIEEDDNKINISNISNIETSTSQISNIESNENVSNEENLNNESSDFKFDFEKVKVKDICTTEECNTFIGTISGTSSRLLGFKYTKENELYIYIDGKEIYKVLGKPIEFISYKNKYLIIVLEKDEYVNRFVMIDGTGKVLLIDDYLESDIEIKNTDAFFETFDCEKESNYTYEATIKVVNGKFKIVMTSQSNNKEQKNICK